MWRFVGIEPDQEGAPEETKACRFPYCAIAILDNRWVQAQPACALRMEKFTLYGGRIAAVDP